MGAKTWDERARDEVDSRLLEFHKGPLSCNRYKLRTQTATTAVLIFFFSLSNEHLACSFRMLILF